MTMPQPDDTRRAQIAEVERLLEDHRGYKCAADYFTHDVGGGCVTCTIATMLLAELARADAEVGRLTRGGCRCPHCRCVCVSCENCGAPAPRREE